MTPSSSRAPRAGIRKAPDPPRRTPGERSAGTPYWGRMEGMHSVLTRPAEGRVVAGVCAGLARYLGLPTGWVRAGVVALTLLSGVGVVFYAWLWIFVPDEHEAVLTAAAIRSIFATDIVWLRTGPALDVEGPLSHGTRRAQNLPRERGISRRHLDPPLVRIRSPGRRPRTDRDHVDLEPVGRVGEVQLPTLRATEHAACLDDRHPQARARRGRASCSVPLWHVVLQLWSGAGTRSGWPFT